ncbi:FAD-binding protein [Bradyrhizobium sp. 190]|uniref:FAD-binding protein n=1 Tax=Bradyrhizobium sp. 190 TaxID=2782658 RepID=UPI001FFBBBCB|nr:FAD-binding protein [Bradyrhizobium sp. 190]MCK1518447.1 FAD-binding protein [Bradyrhizobium sp. 190]
MKNMVRNYDGGITAFPAQLVSPCNVAEIQSILKDVGRYPGPVRAMGSYHSLTPCASSDGTIINMSGMNRTLEIDPKKMTFTAEAGLQFIVASRTLRAQNLQFLTNIEIGNMTLGAAACCHTKDGLDGGEFGQVGSYITGIKWVTPSGDLAEASDANNPALLHFMRSSYGLCGVVYEVTFRIKPLEAIQFSYLPRPIKDLTEKEVDRIIDASKGLICWTVGRRAHFQTRKHVDQVGPFASLFAAGRRRLWNHTEARVGRFIDSRIPTKPLRNASLDAWFAGSKLLMSTLKLVGGATLYNPDKTIDYSRTPSSAKYAFTFWAFPRSQWLDALREYLEFSEKHFKKYDFRCNMPLGSYFIRKDTQSILSYTHDGDVFSIDPIHAYTDKPAWDRFLKEFNEFAYKKNGIPLLNQSPFVERRHVEAAYGARWKQFSVQVKAADPQQRMLNPFFADLLSE